LNGRAALCAGRDDMTSEDEEDENDKFDANHRFSQPDDIKLKLESGAIPDAAMIHAARKRRQKAREQGKKLIFYFPYLYSINFLFRGFHID
jgi:GC-rich sequence DNA-binding factor